MGRSPLFRSVKEARVQIVAGYGQELRELVDYLRDLPEEEWTSPTLCSEWDVRSVVSHLIGQADDFLVPAKRKALTKASKSGIEVVVPFMIETNKRHVREGENLSVAELRGRVQDRRGKVGARLAQIPGFAWRLMRVKGMIPMMLYEALGQTVIEAWVHRQDIQRPRGDGDRNGPFPILLPAIFFGITNMRNYDPPRTINLDTGREGAWHVAPGVGFVPGASPGAEATVRIEPDELVLVAAGRMDADDATVEVDGDKGLGMELLYSARFMGLMPGL